MVHRCRGGFSSKPGHALDTALSGGLHITQTGFQMMRRGAMIAVGVDTHKQRHLAVALDALGQVLGELTVAATAGRLCRAATLG